MDYLLKVTIVWAIFLLLFELLYKNNGMFTANRIYLLLSITLGLLLPLIPSPYNSSVEIIAVREFNIIKESAQTVARITVPQSIHSSPMPETQTITHGLGLMGILGIIYCAGALILLTKYLFELLKIVTMLRKNPVQIFYGHKVINTGKVHSPYSFMSFIFLTDTATHDPRELEYIIQHEAAHNTRKHWLDLWTMQVVNIIFWFNPLVWRYRYLLQLQHEYEADTIAASNDPYTYGRFILQQTLLRGVPSITHSFHFSPIKNRINMLTKINGLRTNNRKYLLLIPALLACNFLMAKSKTESEGEMHSNKMSYKGNTFSWRQSDTLFYDKDKGKAELVPANAKIKPHVIVGINNEPVYNNDHLQAQATYGNISTAFVDYVKDEFQKLRKHTADSLTYITELSVVVDKDGKVVYYNAQYANSDQLSGQQAMWDVMYSWDARANILMDKIIAKSPLWKPASVDGKPVNSYVNVRIPGC